MAYQPIYLADDDPLVEHLRKVGRLPQAPQAPESDFRSEEYSEPSVNDDAWWLPEGMSLEGLRSLSDEEMERLLWQAQQELDQLHHQIFAKGHQARMHFDDIPWSASFKSEEGLEPSFRGQEIRRLELLELRSAAGEQGSSEPEQWFDAQELQDDKVSVDGGHVSDPDTSRHTSSEKTTKLTEELVGHIGGWDASPTNRDARVLGWLPKHLYWVSRKQRLARVRKLGDLEDDSESEQSTNPEDLPGIEVMEDPVQRKKRDEEVAKIPDGHPCKNWARSQPIGVIRIPQWMSRKEDEVKEDIERAEAYKRAREEIAEHPVLNGSSKKRTGSSPTEAIDPKRGESLPGGGKN
ncbi:hypothetical protein K461DRAFT_293833 [Myriangium duriaei CBS 260.36]|uniref:Uncharacterized protein n=1 Tax=Myriangium duriaei CBS 260.36 TaxID=1168546 RepID=A0A9P4J2K9_9PEZI|nr:hypothetical protein K461DRAFT_293833 [Myriangium duriaei CBS 260.36]